MIETLAVNSCAITSNTGIVLESRDAPDVLRPGTARAALFCLLALSGSFLAPSLSGNPLTSQASSVNSSASFDHLVVILMENHPLSSINGSSQAPYMNSLAHTYGLATNYSAITHPSEPNYMALVGGNTFVSGDGNCCFGVDAPNIIDRLEAALLTWKAFAEDATGSGTCAFKPPREADHFPFLEFHNMNTSTRCTNMLTTESRNDPEFLAELNSSNPANLIWLTPNDEDNMHSSSISTGDSYLSALVPSVLSSKLFAERRAALFITFDEGIRTDQTVYAVWAGPVAKRGFRSSSHFSHYSLLKTLETSWGLESLTSNDANATPMEGFLTSITPPEPPSAAGNPPIIWLAVLGLALVLVTAAVILKVRSRSRKT